MALAVLWATHTALHDRESFMAQAEFRTQSMADLAAEQVLRTIEGADTALKASRIQFGSPPDWDSLGNNRSAWQAIRDYGEAMSAIPILYMVDSRGTIRLHGQSFPFRPLDITLVIPPLAVSTPAAYRAWDELGAPRASGPNDLEAAAIAVEPRLAGWRDRITEASGLRPVLAGSGATWFLEGHHDLAAALPDAMVVHTRTDRPQ